MLAPHCRAAAGHVTNTSCEHTTRGGCLGLRGRGPASGVSLQAGHSKAAPVRLGQNQRLLTETPARRGHTPGPVPLRGGGGGLTASPHRWELHRPLCPAASLSEPPEVPSVSASG